MNNRQEELKPLTPALAAVTAKQRRDAVTTAVIGIYDSVHGPEYWPRMTATNKAFVVQFVIDQLNIGLPRAIAHTHRDADNNPIPHHLTADDISNALAVEDVAS